MSDEEDLLVDREDYLAHGVHIGTKAQNKDMEDYIFHVKKNQLAILDLNQTDERIRDAANFLNQYDPEEILVVGRKEEAQKPINVFSEAVGTDLVSGRFMPGTLTNPQSENFTEPEVVVVCDPEEDGQAIDEAVDAKIPVVALVDSENSLENIDLAVPANNKGGNSLGMVYFLIAQQMAEANGEDFGYELEDFKEETEEDEEE
jgi:small subunit ribosomal protein S2